MSGTEIRQSPLGVGGNGASGRLAPLPIRNSGDGATPGAGSPGDVNLKSGAGGSGRAKLSRPLPAVKTPGENRGDDGVTLALEGWSTADIGVVGVAGESQQYRSSSSIPCIAKLSRRCGRGCTGSVSGSTTESSSD